MALVAPPMDLVLGARRLKEKPGAPLSFIDPVLEIQPLHSLSHDAATSSSK